ncbi:B- and T-lymphocyte attenuator-like [Phyllobates terribilis]|uniref:B- and T-lymphocyte attenuator-like n=1 Tax=Phyllobates terribilis TaxID=111132 RepID=UPI003CCB63AE
MDTLAPAFRRGLVVLYMTVSLSLARSLVNGDSSPCRPGITIEQNQNSGTLPGQSLVLHCLVRLCNLELPNVTWCKIAGQQCDPVRTRDGIYSKLEDQKEDSAVYVLKFDSVQMNATGYYQCKANWKDQQIIGRTVELVSQSATEKSTAMNTTETGNTTKGTDTIQNFTLLLYIVSTLGGLCAFIITISLLIYCLRHFKVKHSTSSQDPATTEELQFVAMSGSLKNCPKQTQGGTLKDTDQTAVTVEVTYDNAHLGYKSSPKEEDSIVYADLNYNSKKTIFQFEDDHEVEYATVHLNESREK